MDFQVRVEARDGYVEATLMGVRTPATLMAAAEQVTGVCNELKIFKVLIDVRKMRGKLDTLETFDVAGHKIPQRPGMRLITKSAILDLPPNMDRIRFFETVAVNRGLNVRVFDDEAAAVEWLQG
ncbi:MAG TPA: hypothetical protein VLB51_01225 [Methylomirabilota bacterium]|nr:hypothetical protein [Methylomirabilota bacterium]